LRGGWHEDHKFRRNADAPSDRLLWKNPRFLRGCARRCQDVLGTAAVIQRCQIHKTRKLQALLPKARQAHVRARRCGASASGWLETTRSTVAQTAGYIKGKVEVGTCALEGTKRAQIA